MSAELWISLAGTVLSAVAVVVVALIGRDNAKDKAAAGEDRQRAERRAKRRERESRLSMDMMAAALELGDVTAIAVSGGHTNGNVEAARNKAKAAKDAYEAFLMDEAAYQVAKQ